jgi:hypothetical protein
MRKRPSPLAAVVIVAAVLVAGCGGGSSKLSPLAQKYADSFAKHLSDKTESFGATPTQATCMGEAIMRELGTKPFVTKKVTPADVDTGKSPGELLGAGVVTQKQAAAITKRWDGCVDLPKVLANQLTPQFTLSATSKACLEKALGKGDVATRYLEVSFTGSDVKASASVLSDMFGLVQTCTSDASHKGGYFVDTMSASLAEGGKLTAEQAECVAQHVVDAVGVPKLAQVSSAGSSGTVSKALAAEFNKAVLEAGTTCGVPASLLQG